MNATVETVKGCSTATKVPVPYTEHQKNLNEFLGLTTGEDTVQYRLQKLAEKGFIWSVTRDSIFSKFQYHAGIKGSYTKSVDIPNWAIILSLLVALFGTSAILTLSISLTSIPTNTISGWWALAATPTFAQFIILASIGGREKVIDYVGDIPSCVLEKAETVRSIYPNTNFTIHSHNPLPITERYVKVDPVMVAWVTEEQGVVVGIWDNDKELELV